MKIVIAPDSYKGSLTALEVSENIAIGIKRVDKNIKLDIVPMADGGEGTVIALVESTGGEIVSCIARDPLFRERLSYYGILGDGETAVIEMAAASGLTLLTENEKNPMKTTTYGTGELIINALDRGCKKIIIGLGGSATNDGGIGMASALGAVFYDKKERMVLPCGKALMELGSIDLRHMDERLLDVSIKIASDVENPLYGLQGAAYVYGKQKGANMEMIEQLDEGLKQFAKIVSEQLGKEIANIEGSGAAGGLGAGLLAFCDGEMERGINLVVEATHLEKHIADADLVITGEGRIDEQTTFGKTPYGVAQVAKKCKVPVIAICGSIGEKIEAQYASGLDAIFSIVDRPMTIEEAIQDAPRLLQDLSENVIRLWLATNNKKNREE